MKQEPSQEQLEIISHYYRKGEFETVLSKVTYLLGDFANSTILHNFLGICHNKLGNFQAAIESYNEIVRINPSDSDGYYNLANCYMDLEEFDTAIRVYESVLGINANDAQAYNNMGICWEKKGEFSKAIKSYDNAVKIKPDLTTAHQNRYRALKEKANSDETARG